MHRKAAIWVLNNLHRVEDRAIVAALNPCPVRCVRAGRRELAWVVEHQSRVPRDKVEGRRHVAPAAVGEGVMHHDERELSIGVDVRELNRGVADLKPCV